MIAQLRRVEPDWPRQEAHGRVRSRADKPLVGDLAGGAMEVGYTNGTP